VKLGLTSVGRGMCTSSSLASSRMLCALCRAWVTAARPQSARRTPLRGPSTSRLALTTVRTLTHHVPAIYVHMMPVAFLRHIGSSTLCYMARAYWCSSRQLILHKGQRAATGCCLHLARSLITCYSQLPGAAATLHPANLALFACLAAPSDGSGTALCAVYDPGTASDGKPYCPDYNLYVPLTVT